MNCSDLGKQIKAAREASNMTQRELAEQISCTTQHISAMERGTKQPKLETLVSIANALGSSADFLLRDFLTVPCAPIASQAATILAKLPEEEQLRWLKVLRAFYENTGPVK